MAVLAIGGEVDGIAGAFKRGAKLATQIRFVLNDQNPQSVILEVWLATQNTREAERLLVRNDGRVSIAGANWISRPTCERCGRCAGRHRPR